MEWKKTRQIIAYKGYRNILRKTFLFPNGKKADFDIVDTPSFVCIAAVTKEEQIILVEQYRPGPEQVMLSFPEGQIEADENPEITVRRELLEETGYASENIHFLRKIPEAYSQSVKYIYLATECIKIQNQTLDDNEFIHVLTLSKETFRSLLRDKSVMNFNSIEAGYLLLEELGWL